MKPLAVGDTFGTAMRPVRRFCFFVDSFLLTACVGVAMRCQYDALEFVVYPGGCDTTMRCVVVDDAMMTRCVLQYVYNACTTLR